jgi:hypothetical protein
VRTLHTVGAQHAPALVGGVSGGYLPLNTVLVTYAVHPCAIGLFLGAVSLNGWARVSLKDNPLFGPGIDALRTIGATCTHDIVYGRQVRNTACQGGQTLQRHARALP